MIAEEDPRALKGLDFSPSRLLSAQSLRRVFRLHTRFRETSPTVYEFQLYNDFADVVNEVHLSTEVESNMLLKLVVPEEELDTGPNIAKKTRCRKCPPTCQMVAHHMR